MKTKNFNIINEIINVILFNNTLVRDRKYQSENYSEREEKLKQETGFYNPIFINNDPRNVFSGKFEIQKYFDINSQEEYYRGSYNYQGQECIEIIQSDSFICLKHSGNTRTIKGLKGFCNIYAYEINKI